MPEFSYRTMSFGTVLTTSIYSEHLGDIDHLLSARYYLHASHALARTSPLLCLQLDSQ